MFCTRCGVELRDQDKYCSECGALTGRGTPRAAELARRLVRPIQERKIAGVCAGFARYFDVDVTLVRVIWLVLTVWPLPLLGVISYIVAWIVMPKELALIATQQLQHANETR